jgi:predicted  nucleic acid-binding Zn-ribbon protein
MWKSNKVAGLLNKREKIDKEIKDIQNSCKHPKKTIKSIRERLDSHMTVIRWVCDECLLPIGYPNKKDENNYLKQ